MIKATKISTIRHYLVVLGLQLESSSSGFEMWQGHNKAVLICVSESLMPVFSIISMITELDETPESFIRITGVIR
jgi:hypothetical protein